MSIRVSELIRRGSLYVPVAEIPDLEGLKKDLTVVSKFESKEEVPLYDDSLESSGWLGVPRGYEHLFAPERVTDELVRERPADIVFKGQLRDAQIPVIRGFETSMDQHPCCLINAPTGSGKTIMLLHILSLLRVQTLIVVPKSDLVRQWIDRIVEYTNLTAEDVGLVRQDTCDFEKPIVVGMIHSLCRRDYGLDFRRAFGCIVFDEVHKLGALHFSKTGGLFPAYRRIGATATMKRPDGMSPVFEAHLGSHVVRPEVSEQPIPKVIVVPYKESSGKIPSYLHDDLQKRGVLLSRLANNSKRTARIADLVQQVEKTSRRVLVVSERINQLEEIYAALTSEYGYAQDDVGLYLGSTKDADREKIARDCKIILSTTGMLSMGTDIPTLRGLIMATPVSHVDQLLGRIRRIAPDVKEPVVVDIVDLAHEEASRWYQARKTLYKRLGCSMSLLEG